MKKIDDLIAIATVGSPVRRWAPSVYPITSTDKCASPYLVLDDALATGPFRITEASESGSVSPSQIDLIPRRCTRRMLFFTTASNIQAVRRGQPF